jgi:protease I
MTSWPSLRTDLQNAGATWVNEQVVIDNNLLTSQKPSDIPIINEKMIGLFAQGRRGNLSTTSARQ